MLSSKQKRAWRLWEFLQKECAGHAKGVKEAYAMRKMSDLGWIFSINKSGKGKWIHKRSKK